jgi:hypothetical protein
MPASAGGASSVSQNWNSEKPAGATGSSSCNQPTWEAARANRRNQCDMSNIQLIQTLTESFVALSDEVQSLIDRKTILEHKLRYAHEQVCRILFFFFFSAASVMISFSSRSGAVSQGSTADGDNFSV